MSDIVSTMTSDSVAYPVVRPVDILSGLGSLTRAEMCQMIALIECVDGVFLAKSAVSGIGARLGISTEIAAGQLETAQDNLAKHSATDDDLRFRLWTRLTEALAIPSEPPLSTKSATKAASAFAVRAAERLTPSIKSRQAKTAGDTPGTYSSEWVASKAGSCWKAVRDATKAESPLPFPEVVAEELQELLEDDAVAKALDQNADPEIAKALREGQARARNSIAAAGVWAGGAAVVANAGFAPYIVAAQLSAVIPMVSGPALVSLLATLINPLTVFVGVATLGWLGMGRGARIVRSQLASRLGVILATKGIRNRDAGLQQFLTGMRAPGGAGSEALEWMPEKDRTEMRRRFSALSAGFEGPLSAPAGGSARAMGEQEGVY